MAGVTSDAQEVELQVLCRWHVHKLRLVRLVGFLLIWGTALYGFAYLQSCIVN